MVGLVWGDAWDMGHCSAVHESPARSAIATHQCLFGLVFHLLPFLLGALDLLLCGCKVERERLQLRSGGAGEGEVEAGWARSPQGLLVEPLHTCLLHLLDHPLHLRQQGVHGAAAQRPLLSAQGYDLSLGPS